MVAMYATLADHGDHAGTLGDQFVDGHLIGGVIHEYELVA